MSLSNRPWGEEDDDCHVEYYVFGKMDAHDTAFPTLVVISSTTDGWRVRSTNRGYNHDYVCLESFRDVMEWIDADMHRPFIAEGRNEVLDTLTDNIDREHRTGCFFAGGLQSGSLEEAECVLSHLETGW